MIFLLKCLVTLLQNPQPPSHSKYVQNPTFQLDHTQERGLPFLLLLPIGLNVRPGELVDLTILNQPN
jgi:hypothetical protein